MADDDDNEDRGSTAPPETGGTPRYCLRCFYDLRGLPENRCPECGRFFDPDDPRTYSATVSPERLRNAVKQAASAVSETWRMLNPPPAPEPRGLMTPHEWFL